MSSTFFITGTDTDVGKTLVAAALLHRARALGLRVAAVKPVAAGCHWSQNQWQNEDAILLRQVAGSRLSYSQVNPVALEPAIAPHIAARQIGMNLRAADLARHCRTIMDGDTDLVIIEGAGGWRVPLNASETVASLAQQLGMPVILVVAMRLGCLNHALLTAEAISRDGLQLSGWIANSPNPAMDQYADNLVTLRQRLGAPLLGEIPYQPGVAVSATAELVRLPGEVTSGS